MTTPIDYDPAQAVRKAPMSALQWAIVAVMVGLNGLDGFDALAISFAAPGILREWAISRATLGVVMSMELLGMTVGSLVLGGLADAIGRRFTILLCLGCMSIGMASAGFVPGVVPLCIARVLTGFGIGGMLAATNAAVAEAANERRRPLVIVLMAAGFPIGSIVGGAVAVRLLGSYTWHSVFLFGAICSALFIPLVLWFAPDSVEFEMHRRAAGALARVNRLLRRMGHSAITALPAGIAAMPSRKVPIQAAFSPSLRWTTVLLAVAYFANITTFHFLFKWTGQAVADMGFTQPDAASVLVWASTGGLIGCLVFALLSGAVSVLWLTTAAAAAAAVAVAVLGRVPHNLAMLSAGALGAGLFTNAAVVGLYVLSASLFPVGVRASATGFIIGIGRGGAVLAPVIAGLLFSAGHGFGPVSLLMGMGSAICAVALVTLGALLRRSVAAAKAKGGAS